MPSPRHHHLPSAPASPAAPTAPRPALHPRYQTTALPQSDAHVNATESLARVTVSSWTVEEAAVVTVMIRARAVHLMTSRHIPRRDAKALLSDDEPTINWGRRGGNEMREIRRSFVNNGFLLCLQHPARVGTGFFHATGTHTKPIVLYVAKFSCTSF